MKITITQDFGTVEEAVAFLGRTLAPLAVAEVGSVAVRLEPTSSSDVINSTEKKPRKGRSDAGQPRGPYKTAGGAGDPPAGATGPAPQGLLPSTSSAAPAKSSAVEPPQATPAPEAADLTLEVVRAEMAKLHALPNKGTTACLAALKHFGVARISDLPKEKYAEFVKYVHEQIAA